MCSTIFWLSMLCCSKTCFVREKSKQFNNFSSICSKTFLLPRLCSLCCSELFLPRQKKTLEQHNLDNRKSFRTYYLIELQVTTQQKTNHWLTIFSSCIDQRVATKGSGPFGRDHDKDWQNWHCDFNTSRHGSESSYSSCLYVKHT